jgi:hypothetical protein
VRRSTLPHGAAIERARAALDHGMPRRMLFPLRRCQGLVPIRELDLDIVVVVMNADVTPRSVSPSARRRR